MKVLVVYYSRTGTTKKIADLIASKLDADTEEILDVKSRKGALGYMRSGKEAMKRSIPDIQEPKIDPAGYDLVVLGTPIWSWNMSSPMRAYLDRFKADMPQLAFFCTMGGSGDDKAFREMEDICHTVPKATLTLTTKEVQQNRYEDKVEAFLDKIDGGEEDGEEEPAEEDR